LFADIFSRTRNSSLRKLYLGTGKTFRWPNRHARSSNSRMQTPAPLKGLIFTDTGAAMTPTATKKRGKLYRYYVSMDVIKNRTTEDDSASDLAPTRLPAGMGEDAIVTEVRRRC